MTNKKLVYSLLFILLTIVSYLIILNNSYIDVVYSYLNIAKVDLFLSKITGGKIYSSLDLIIYIPIITLAFAVFFGLQSFKDNSELSPKIRLLSIATTTLSICFFIIATLSFFIV